MTPRYLLLLFAVFAFASACAAYAAYPEKPVRIIVPYPPGGNIDITAGTLTTAPALYPRLGYDPVKDFAMTSLVSVVPLVMVVHPSVPARSVKEFIALLKVRPSRITMASAGSGTTNHLGGELFQAATGTRMIHVPYKGSGPALVDLMGG